MRYRVKDYTIEGQMIILPYEITLEDLRLLTNETQEISLCSSMFKNKALIKKDGIWTEIPNAISISGNIITVTLEACTLQPTDKLTIEIDKGDSSEELAKQGDNQEATNTAIYALLSQFGESVLQEAVTVICNCAEDIAWEEYGVVITYADGTSQSLPMSENGTCSFSVKIGQEYSVQLPVIGAYITPTLNTYTASTSSRQIYWSYVVSGVFGLDELGRRYTIEQIEALEDKSIIKYGGFTDETLENSPRDDGTTGNGFMWDLYQETISREWGGYGIGFNTDLLPYTEASASLKLYNGAAYTRYIISEGKRLSVSTPAATVCANRTIDINHETKSGFLLSGGQINKLIVNYSSFSLLYDTLGITVQTLKNSRWWTSNQRSADHVVTPVNGNMNYSNKNYAGFILVAFDLPK